jgi:hypothetical protein
MNCLMRFSGLFLVAACTLLAQGVGETLVAFDTGIIKTDYVVSVLGGEQLFSANTYFWEITRLEDGSKRFRFQAKECIYADATGLYRDPLTPVCTTITQTAATELAPVSAGLRKFYSLAPEVEHHTPIYLDKVKSIRPEAIIKPVIPPHPQLIAFNGFTYDFFKYDLATNQFITSVVLAPQARMFAERPGSVDASEVWVGHGGLIDQVSIVDLAAGKVLATIPTTSLDPNNSEPTGLVFTNGGATALYTAKFFQADSAGNYGALVVLDAVNRRVLSTQPMKVAPEALLMAPDGLTAYLMGGSKITYYDVLSGTSDLTVPFTYFSPDKVSIHPDGTRIFFDQGQQLGVFDVVTRKITYIKYGLPNNAQVVSVRLTQDGSRIYVTDGKGNVVVLGTRYGDILSTYQTNATTTEVFPAPVVN